MVLFADVGKKLDDKFNAPFVHGNPWCLEYHVGPKGHGFRHEAKVTKEGPVIGSTTAKHSFEGIDTEIKLHSKGNASFSAEKELNTTTPCRLGVHLKQPDSAKSVERSLEVNGGFTAKDCQTHAQYFPLTNSYKLSGVYAPQTVPRLYLGAEVSGPVGKVLPSYCLTGHAQYDQLKNRYELLVKTAPADGDKLGKVTGTASAKLADLNSLVAARASYALTSGAYTADLMAETSVKDSANTTLGAKIDHKAKICAYLARDVSENLTVTMGTKIPSAMKMSIDDIEYGVKFTMRDQSHT